MISWIFKKLGISKQIWSECRDTESVVDSGPMS